MASGAPSESQYFYVHLGPSPDSAVVQAKLHDILGHPERMPSFDFVIEQMRVRFGRAPIDFIDLTRPTTAKNLGQDYPHYPVLEVRNNEILDVMTALQFASRVAGVVTIH